MMTKANMIQAARSGINDADNAQAGSSRQYNAAVTALGMACMAIGAAQEPWDQPTVDEGWRLRKNAEKLLQACIAAQCDAHFKEGAREGAARERKGQGDYAEVCLG